MVKSYCPKCQDVYTPKSSRHHHTDGAYFGSGFPHMLFMVHPEYRPKRPANQFSPRYAVFLLVALLVLLVNRLLAPSLMRLSLKPAWIWIAEGASKVVRDFRPNNLQSTSAFSIHPHEATYSAAQPRHWIPLATLFSVFCYMLNGHVTEWEQCFTNQLQTCGHQSSFMFLFQTIFRLYGFKIHPLAYQLQYQAAANHKIPMRGIGYNNGKRWRKPTSLHAWQC